MPCALFIGIREGKFDQSKIVAIFGFSSPRDAGISAKQRIVAVSGNMIGRWASDSEIPRSYFFGKNTLLGLYT
jgi:predicted metalloprotease with PDZ domain